MATETEIKFSAEGFATLDELAGQTEIAGYGIVDMGKKLQTDYCFDTADLRFFHEKIVFRLRVRDNGSVLTFKAQVKDGSAAEDNLYRRIEIEQPTMASAEEIIAGPLPDIPPVHALVETVGAVELVPSITIANKRRIMLLMNDDDPQYEMVLDDVTFTGPGGTAQVCEVEVETIAGGECGLKKIGKWLKRRFDLHHAGSSKYILGMELVGGV